MTESKSLCYVNKAQLIRQDHLENLVMKTIKVGIGLLLRLTRSGKIAKNHAATSQRWEQFFIYSSDHSSTLAIRLGIWFALSTQMAEAAERFAHKPLVNDGILIEDMQREPMW